MIERRHLRRALAVDDHVPVERPADRSSSGVANAASSTRAPHEHHRAAGCPSTARSAGRRATRSATRSTAAIAAPATIGVLRRGTPCGAIDAAASGCGRRLAPVHRRRGVAAVGPAWAAARGGSCCAAGAHHGLPRSRRQRRRFAHGGGCAYAAAALCAATVATTEPAPRSTDAAAVAAAGAGAAAAARLRGCGGVG